MLAFRHTVLIIVHSDQCGVYFYFFISNLIYLCQLKNLAKDYWSSTFSIKFKQETDTRTGCNELEQLGGCNFSPRLSSVHCADDPFHQEHHSAGDSARNSYDLELQ